MQYSSLEMMTIACSRRISDDDVVFCGTGLPMLAAMTAKYTHAPNCTVFFETGSVDPQFNEIPMTVADSRVMYRASHHGGLADAFAYMQNKFTGPKVVGILSGAQIDAYGNLNSTVIGDYRKPSVRLPGSGGACDVACFVGKTMIFMKHEQRRFVEELDYLTSPGWLRGDDSREEVGLPKGGPEFVITTLGVMAFKDSTKRMYVHRHFEATNLDDIQKHTGFEIDTSRSKVEPAPGEEELRILREKVDPLRLILS
jgi:glutaconate CoA-transferase subunit B